MNPFFQNIADFLRRLTLGQRVALGGVLAGTLALLIGVAMWANQPDYVFLFGNLDPATAGRMVERLEADGIPYELRDQQSAIFVPREYRDELRVALAAEGFVEDGPPGYEIIENRPLGTTPEEWEVMRRRVLEGELARTITGLRQVESARVHLVIPKRAAFREAQQQPSASVALALTSGAQLSPQQIEGITALIASSVEGLTPSNVTIIDNRGNLLSNPDAGDPNMTATSNQLKHQREIEHLRAMDAQSMLDQVLGPGNAIVRVAAELDFTEKVDQIREIDPESATVISEERLQEEEGQATASYSQTVRNYDISEKATTVRNNRGQIKYLTVSVLLNYKRVAPAPQDGEAAEDATPRYEPYTPAELASYEELVKNAVAFNPDRGDRITITQMRFDTSVDEQLAEEIRLQQRDQQIQTYLRYGLMVLALALAAWLLRSTSRRVTELTVPEAPALGEASAAPALDAADAPRQIGTGTDETPPQLEEGEELMLVDDVYASKLSPEARARLRARHKMFEEIKEQVNERPEDAADLIRSWMVPTAVES